MKRMIEVVTIRKDGHLVKVLINVDDISNIQKSSTGNPVSFIEFSSGEFIRADESYESIKSRLEELRKKSIIMELTKSAITGLASNHNTPIETSSNHKSGWFNLIDYDKFSENVIGIAEEVYKKLYN